MNVDVLCAYTRVATWLVPCNCFTVLFCILDSEVQNNKTVVRRGVAHGRKTIDSLVANLNQ